MKSYRFLKKKKKKETLLKLLNSNMHTPESVI